MNVKRLVLGWVCLFVAISAWFLSYHLLVEGGLATVQIAEAEPNSLNIDEVRVLFARQSLGTLVGRPLYISSLVGTYLAAFAVVYELWSYAKK